MTPRSLQIAASLKAWNRNDCHPRQAILDSGASDHFMPMSYKGNQEKLTNCGITVTCANGGQLVSTATDIINFHGIPTAAKKCHKFPNHQLVDPLLSLGKLTEHGCNVNFKKNTVEVTNSDGITTLVGQKPIGRNIYTVALPLGTTQNIPQDIQTFINHAAVPKISGVPTKSTTKAVADTASCTRPKNTNYEVSHEETTNHEVSQELKMHTRSRNIQTRSQNVNYGVSHYVARSENMLTNTT